MFCKSDIEPEPCMFEHNVEGNLFQCDNELCGAVYEIEGIRTPNIRVYNIPSYLIPNYPVNEDD